MANEQKNRRWFWRGGMELIFEGHDNLGRRVYRVLHAGNLFKKK